MTCARTLSLLLPLCLLPACYGDTNSGTSPTGTTLPGGGGTTTPQQPGLKSCQGLSGPCSTSLTALPLTGCAFGDYAADVTVGAQQFSLVMDSGSGTMGIAGATCPTCAGVSPAYTPGTTATEVGTPVTSMYVDGSGWSGVSYRDTVTLAAGLPPVNMTFAEITQVSMTSQGRNFFSPTYCTGKAKAPTTQGIFGLASTALALKGTDVYLDDLKGTGKLADAFSFQPCDLDGNLWFGGYDPTHITAAPQFTPMDSSSGSYVVTLSDLAVDGQSLGLPTASYGSTIVDTGTSIMIAPPAIVNALAQQVEANAAFQKYFGTGWFSGNGDCTPAAGNASKAELDANLPPLQLKFPQVNGTGSITVTVPATESYLTPSFTPTGGLCFAPGILGATLSNKENLILFGNSVMHSQVVIFDRANNQLGFAPETGCK